MFICKIQKADVKAHWKMLSSSEFRNKHITHQSKKLNCRTRFGMDRFNTLRPRTNGRHFAGHKSLLILTDNCRMPSLAFNARSPIPSFEIKFPISGGFGSLYQFIKYYEIIFVINNSNYIYIYIRLHHFIHISDCNVDLKACMCMWFHYFNFVDF